MRGVLLMAVAIGLSGCAGHSQYMASNVAKRPPLSKVIAKPRADVWDSAVPNLAKRFFVVNTIDRSSGLIGLSFSGDPEPLLDCGTITIQGGGLNGNAVTTFPGSRARQQYRQFTPFVGNIQADRTMQLEGRINLIFEATGATETRVTAAVRFVVTRKVDLINLGNGQRGQQNESINFDSGGAASFAQTANAAVTCASTGELERQLLDAVN